MKVSNYCWRRNVTSLPETTTPTSLRFLRDGESCRTRSQNVLRFDDKIRVLTSWVRNSGRRMVAIWDQSTGTSGSDAAQSIFSKKDTCRTSNFSKSGIFLQNLISGLQYTSSSLRLRKCFGNTEIGIAHKSTCSRQGIESNPFSIASSPGALSG